jgi:hypothetical protein
MNCAPTPSQGVAHEDVHHAHNNVKINIILSRNSEVEIILIELYYFNS